MFHVKKSHFSINSIRQFLPYALIVMGFGVMLVSSLWGSEYTKIWQSLSILKETGVSRVLPGTLGFQPQWEEPVYYVQQIWLPTAVTVPTWIWQVAGISLWILWFGFAYAFLSKGKSYFGLWMVFLALSFFCFRWEVVWNTTNPYVYFGLVFIIGLFSHGLVHGWISVGRQLGLAIMAFLLFSVSLYLGKSKEPLATMWGYGSLWLFGMALWFIAWSGPTLLAGMYSLIFQNSEKGKSNWKTLVLIFTIYAINLLWMYAHEVKWIEDSTPWLAPIHLWAISCFSGWWFWNQKGGQNAPHHFSRIMWIAGFLSVVLIYSWSELAWLDAWKEVLSEWITISFFWMGLAYLLHLLVNFFQPIQAGINITPIWQQPRRFPWLLTQLGGIVACFVTLSFKNGYTVDQAIAGSLYQQADYHHQVGEETVAETLYREGLVYDPYGWKGNYSLGMLARKHQDPTLAATYFQRITQKNAEPSAVIALAQSLESENLFFEGVFGLQKAIQKKPDARVMTQLAYLFDRANLQDSANYYRSMAYEWAPEQSVEKSNYLISWIDQGKLPSVQPPQSPLTIGEKANWMALAKVHDQSWVFEPDTTLPRGVDRFAWVFNQVTTAKEKFWDPTSWERGAPGWELFQKELVYAKAVHLYNLGYRREGIDVMQRQIISATDSIPNLFLFQYGTWLVEQGAWGPFQKNVFPRLSQSQQGKIKTIEAWKRKQKEQWEEWRGRSLSPEETWNQYPFNERIILDQVNQMIKKQGKDKAYRYLVRALDFYDEPIAWWEKYVELANELGLSSYAKDGLEEIKKRQ